MTLSLAGSLFEPYAQNLLKDGGYAAEVPKCSQWILGATGATAANKRGEFSHVFKGSIL
jgi:hypothetical protein